MLIDCDLCTVRGVACGDCVVTVLLGATVLRADPASSSGAPAAELDRTDRAALRVLADAGLVPRLRHQHRVAG